MVEDATAHVGGAGDDTGVFSPIDSRAVGANLVKPQASTRTGARGRVRHHVLLGPSGASLA